MHLAFCFGLIITAVVSVVAAPETLVAQAWTIVELKDVTHNDGSFTQTLPAPTADINGLGESVGGPFRFSPLTGVEEEVPTFFTNVRDRLAKISSTGRAIGTSTSLAPSCNGSVSGIGTTVNLPRGISLSGTHVVGNCFTPPPPAPCLIIGGACSETVAFPSSLQGTLYPDNPVPVFEPNDVDDNGLVAGTKYESNGDSEAALFSEAGGLVRLGTLGGTKSAALALFNSRVTGWAETPSGDRHAFLRDPDMSLIDLGTLGGTSSEGHDITGNGIVVGQSKNSAGENRAFMFSEATGMQDLNDFVPAGSGWVLRDAVAIGLGILGTGTRYGESRGFILRAPQAQLPGDKYFNETRVPDIAVWRPSNGTWYIRNLVTATQSPDRVQVRQWGLPGDVPVQADVDNDGLLDLVVWRPPNGTWYICRSSDQYDCSKARTKQFGLPGDVPLVGDIDRDGETDLIVWRRSLGLWIAERSSDQQLLIRQWGLPEDVPLVGSYDGDEFSDLVVWRPSTGTWYILGSGSVFDTRPGRFAVRQWGLPGDVPVGADIDGDSFNELVVFRPANGTWYVNKLGLVLEAVQWGLPGDIPISFDADGDGGQNYVVWRPSNGTWYARGINITHIQVTPLPGGGVNRVISRDGSIRQWGLPEDLPIGAASSG